MLNPTPTNQTQENKIGIFNTMIASGPVIIQDNKVLLVKHGDKPINELKWKFPGGRLLKNYSLKDNALREAQKEIGVTVKIVSELPTLELWDETPEIGTDKPELIILVHYLAEINQKPIQGKEVLAMDWFAIDNLPTDCAPNIKPIIETYKKTNELF